MSILFHLAFTGSGLGNVLAIYLLLRERTVAAGTADELATALRACWARAEIERLAELLDACFTEAVLLGFSADEVRDLISAPEHQGSLLLERLPSGRHRWWTFAGGAVNSALVLKLGEIGSTRVDDLWVETGPGVPVPELIQRQKIGRAHV